MGSYGWSGESPDILTDYLTKARIKVIDKGLKLRFMPNDKELEECITFGKSFGEKLLEAF